MNFTSRRHRLAYHRGVKAHQDGEAFERNPYRYLKAEHALVYSSLFDKGWNDSKSGRVDERFYR